MIKQISIHYYLEEYHKIEVRCVLLPATKHKVRFTIGWSLEESYHSLTSPYHNSFVTSYIHLWNKFTDITLSRARVPKTKICGKQFKQTKKLSGDANGKHVLLWHCHAFLHIPWFAVKATVSLHWWSALPGALLMDPARPELQAKYMCA